MLKRINVTQKRINKGVRCDGERCPVAIAIKAHLKAEIIPYVGALINFFEPTSRWVIDPVHISVGPRFVSNRGQASPEQVKRFIFRFDSDEDLQVEPFTFTIDIPDQYLRTEAKR